MLYELRILSGLHRGAILPLGSESITIGSHEDADIVLVDPDIKQIHASLTPGDSGWVFTSKDGEVYSLNSPQSFKETSVDSGEPICIGSIWVGVFADGDPWPDPPQHRPMPVAAADATENLSNQAQAAGDKPAQTENTPVTKPIITKKKAKLLRIGALPVLVGAIATAAAAYAFTTKPEPAGDAKPQLEQRPTMVVETQTPVKPASASQQIETPIPQPVPEASSSPSSEDLKKAFRKKLADAELIKRFEMELGDTSWTMRADLDDDEAARFERILKSFVAEKKISFPINAKVVTAEGMLPFKIKQVTSGTNASIVTTDGDRLYVGDELNGVRLTSISGNKLTFTGNRKIEIRW